MVLSLLLCADVLQPVGRGPEICRARSKGRARLSLDMASGRKLRYYFGDKKGALEAVKQGLSLEPGDYEFLTLGREIELGASLEQMEFHWINPDADRDLLNGLDEEADDKRCTISCLTVNPEGLARFHRIFTPRTGY